MAAPKRKLVTYVHVNGVAYGPDDDVPADVAKQITNPAAWDGGSSADDDDDGGDSTPDYSSMKVDELKAEIERRNETRSEDGQLSTEGKKADLVAVLEADDASA